MSRLLPVMAVLIVAFAGTAGGATAGECRSCGPPLVVTGAASQVTAGSAVIGGTLTPGINKKGTLYWVQLGPTTAYGTSTPYQWAASSTVARATSTSVAGLTAGRTYHYRLVAWSQ